MSYSFSCACGVMLAVSARQAGSTLKCTCGRSLNVPNLSSLRTSAGESPYPRSTIEKIRAMIRHGELPIGEVCPYSGRPANETVFFHVQCERSTIKGDGRTAASIIVGFFIGIRGLRKLGDQSRPTEEIGRNTLIEVPLRVSSDVRRKVLGIHNQKKLKEMLCQTQIYAELLREFPDATVKPIASD